VNGGGGVLVLGGTREGRELAEALHRSGIPVVSSLAGRVRNPRVPHGEVRVGGFGGASGLTRWLTDRRPEAVVDATHPFAAQISAAAVSACRDAGVPLLRLERPRWRERPGDRWHRAPDLAQAAALIPRLGSRVLLTTGRQGVAAFAPVTSAWFLIRCLQEPEPPLPPSCRILVDRGPYTLRGELDLMREHRIDLLVTKESGGRDTQAKLDAARELGLPVIVVARPSSSAAAAVDDVGAALSWVREVTAAGARGAPS
jgi:precorrin-6A/cobalt-precorrin-6A reductase